MQSDPQRQEDVHNIRDAIRQISKESSVAVDLGAGLSTHERENCISTSAYESDDCPTSSTLGGTPRGQE